MSTTTISIKLPIALDVAATLTRLIGAAYPNASVTTDPNSSDHMSFQVDLEDRVEDEDALEAILEQFEATPIDPEVGESTYSKYGVEPPQWLAQAIGAVAAEYLDDADNYKQTEFTMLHKGQEMVMIVARSQEQTPHALRMKAEDRIQMLEEALRQAGVDPEAV